MIILGIDPGYGRTGYGVLEKTSTGLHALCNGCIETSKNFSQEKRLEEIYTSLSNIMKDFPPQLMALEKLFFVKNTTTALRVAETRGIILLLAKQQSIPICEYSPMDVKIAVSGYGKAEKSQVQTMVTKLLKLSSVPKPDDAADALAIAITAAHSYAYFSVINSNASDRS